MKTRIKIPQWLAYQKDVATQLEVLGVLSKTDKAIRVKAIVDIMPSSHCLRCHRKLTHPISLKVGIGPTCSARLGIGWYAEVSEEEYMSWVERSEKIVWLPISQIEILEGNLGINEDPIQSLGKVVLKHDSIIMDTLYHPDLVEEIKNIQGRQWDKIAKHWVLPIMEYKNVLKIARKYKLRYERGLEEVRDKLIDSYNNSSKGDANEKIVINGKALYPFQVAGIQYLEAHKGNVLITDEMGLGKSLQALTYIERNKKLPVLIICPASLMINWKREILKWYPDRKIQRVKTTDFEISDNIDYLIVNYSKIWRNDSQKKLKNYRFKTMVIDESHFVKAYKSNRSLACQDIAKTIPHKLLLTGTPILNRPIELVPQLKILNQLNNMGGWQYYIDKYCDAQPTPFGMNLSGASNIDELQKKLRAVCMVRREKEDVLKELPAKQEIEVFLPINNWKWYVMAQNSLSRYRKARYAKDKKPIEETIPEELINAKSLVDGDVVSKIVILKHLAGEGKVKAGLAWLQNALKQEEKIVVFSHHHSVMHDYWMGIDENDHPECMSTKLHGKMSEKQKQISIDQFQNSPNCRVMFASIRAAGVGITLTAARTVVFTELDWNYAWHEQASDRVHRIGQDKNVQVYYLLAENTIDEQIYQMIRNKQDITKQLTKLKEIL